MFREVTDLAAQVHQMKASLDSVDDTLKLMARAGELVRSLEKWTPDVSIVDQEHMDSVEHFNAIWQLGLLCFIHHEIYTLNSSDARIQKYVALAIEPLRKLSWLQACLFPLFMLAVHAQTSESRSAIEESLSVMHTSLAFQTPLTLLLSLKKVWSHTDTYGAAASRWRDLFRNTTREFNILL